MNPAEKWKRPVLPTPTRIRLREPEMSNTHTISHASQLEALRAVTLTDDEVWSARDLMPFAGYERWERFSDAINRAMASVNASGLSASDHFRGTAKMVGLGSGARRQVEDFELTRYGCYILFQNADARKPEIAAAQQYFAVQTRKQELADAPMISDDEIVQRALQITASRVKALEAKVIEDAPKVAEAETFRKSAGLSLIGDLANDLKVHAAANLPGVKILHQDVFDHAGRLGLIIRGNTVRNNQPTARAIEAGWVKPARHEHESDTHGLQTKQYTRLTPKGFGRLWDGCLAWIDEHGTLDPHAADNYVAGRELAAANDWKAAS